MVKTSIRPSESLIKFYTSLLKQRPNSEMAIKWCQKHNLIIQNNKLCYILKKMKI